MLGFKHSEENLLKFSINLRGKKFIKKQNLTSPRITNQETINKLKLRSKGVIIKVFDKNENLIHQFDSISQAAKTLNLSRTTIRD
jgi:hypothetical protein